MRVDYVRVYQRKGQTNVGCDGKNGARPTRQYIEDHLDAYTSEWFDLDVCGLCYASRFSFPHIFSLPSSISPHDVAYCSSRFLYSMLRFFPSCSTFLYSMPSAPSPTLTLIMHDTDEMVVVDPNLTVWTQTKYPKPKNGLFAGGC